MRFCPALDPPQNHRQLGLPLPTKSARSSRGKEPLRCSARQVMDELAARFILSLPEEEFSSFERLFFQVPPTRPTRPPSPASSPLVSASSELAGPCN